MKRLIGILMILAAFVWTSNAQTIHLGSNQLYESYTATAADTAKSTTEKTFDIFVGKGFMYYYDVQVDADSAGDGSNFTVRLKGSNDESNWYNVGDAVTWYVTDEDTLIRFTNMTSVSTSTSYGASTDYHDFDFPLRYEYHDMDTCSDGDAFYNDTVTIPAYVLTDTVTLGLRTVTETLSEASVGWRYLRVSFTGADTGAKAELVTLTVAIRPKLFQY